MNAPAVFPRVGFWSWAGIVLLTLVAYFWFPGNQYLRSDTLIYVPILEHQQNPVLFSNDIMAVRPFQYSIYDQAAALLTSYTPLPLQRALQVEHILFRGLEIAGVTLIGLGLGLPPLGAWLAAAILSLGASVGGMLTVEPEPVPRAFALGCAVFGTGLAIRGRPVWAAVIGAIAFLYHPTSAVAFVAALGLVFLMQREFIPLAVLAAGPVCLFLLAHSGATAAEMPSVFHRLLPAEEAFQRMITPGLFVSEWRPRVFAEIAVWCAVGGLACWTLRDRLRGRAILLPILLIAGACSVPLSWVILEGAGFPQVQSARALPLVGIVTGVMATACGFLAAERNEWVKATAWFAVTLILPFEGALVTWFVTPAALVSIGALLAVLMVGLWLSKRTHGGTVVLAGLLPFIVAPMGGLAEAPNNQETAGLDDVAKWAQKNTAEDALFLFPDSGYSLQPSLFRVLAGRSLYVDWKARGQANYFPAFADEWWRRWKDTNEGRWIPSQDDLPGLRTRHVDFLIVRNADAITGLNAVFQNAEFQVYSVE